MHNIQDYSTLSREEDTFVSLPIGVVNQYPSTVRWSNGLVNAPLAYNLLERRLIYFLTVMVNRRCKELNLHDIQSWKDLYFHLEDKDLKLIGGDTHVLQTYQALSNIGEKFVSAMKINTDGQKLVGKVHWVDSFWYNTETSTYDVRMSPEIMEFIIDLAKNFTTFNPWTALKMSTRYGQKMYEICCEFSGKFQMSDPFGNTLRPNVVYFSIERLRELFSINEIIDARTNKIIQKEKYSNFNSLQSRILDPARNELYELHLDSLCDVWFDYWPLRKGRGRKTIGLYLGNFSQRRHFYITRTTYLPPDALVIAKK